MTNLKTGLLGVGLGADLLQEEQDEDETGESEHEVGAHQLQHRVRRRSHRCKKERDGSEARIHKHDVVRAREGVR